MKYLIKYFPFYEGAIPKGKSGALSMAQSLSRYLEASPAMQDIKALVSKGRVSPKRRKETGAQDEHGEINADKMPSRVKEPMSYTVKKEGDIYFDKTASYRYFGQEAYLLRQPNGDYKLRIEENSKLTFEKVYENIEDALRNCWAFFVSRTKEYKVSTRYVNEITRKLLMEPNKHLFWGEKKTAVEIVQALGLTTLDPAEGSEEAPVNMDNTRHLLNEVYGILGMKFESAGKNLIQIPTAFGVARENQDNLLSLLLRAYFGKNSSNGATYENPSKTENKCEGRRVIFPMTSFHDDDGRSGKYFTQPRTTEEAYIQCLQKVYKVYFKHYRDYGYEKVYYGGASIKTDIFRIFIYRYTAIIMNEVKANGLDALNEPDLPYRAIYASIVKDADSEVFKLANIVKTNAPSLWDKISSYDVSGMNDAADMGEMGFGD